MQNRELSKLIELLEKHKNIFLTGGAGVGKSFLVNSLISKYKTLALNVVTLGSTGISAVNVGGVTIHSFFGFGICNSLEELKKFDVRNRRKLSHLKKILEITDLIVIDEISMVSASLFDMIVYRLRELDYRGKILLVGDFFQLPPIIKKREIEDNLFNEEFAFESSSWNYLNPLIVELTKIKRTKDIEFSKILHSIRIGELNSNTLEYLKNLTKKREIEEATYLYGTNALVFNKNLSSLKKISKKEQKIISIVDIYDRNLSQQKISNWIKSLPIEEELRIKVGAKILFTINRWGEYYNGEKGVIKKIDGDEIIIEKLSGEEIILERNRFTYSNYVTEMLEDGSLGVKENELAEVYQFPIKLAYAVTIHKSQGMSIDNLVCNIDRIFAESQFYVAISRAINPSSLMIEYSKNNFEKHLQKIVRVSEKVTNFYKKVDTLKLD